MKILEIVSYLYPALSYGGPAKVVYDLAEELSKNHEVTVYTTDVWDGSRRIKEEEKLKSTKKLKIIYFKNIINNFAYKYRFFTGFGMVLQYLKEKNNFTVVHIHDVFIIPQLLIGCLAILFRKKYVINPHGVLDPIRTKDKSAFKKILYNLLAKVVLENAQYLIATSKEEEKILRDLNFKKVTTVYNGISLEKVEKKVSEYKKYGTKNLFTLLYIGKIHPLKGLDQLLVSLSLMKSNFQLLIAGPDDGAKKDLLRIIRDKGLKSIYFLGFVNDEEKAELYWRADLFVHPSLSEGFSMSILEALKYGLPILITNACNFDDVKIYNAGFVLNEKHLQEEIIKTLEKVERNPEVLKLMSKNGINLIKSKYSIRKMANDMEEIYNRL